MRFAVDGQEIDYEVRGAADGRALFFLHGLTTDRRLMLEAFEPAFAARPGWRRVYLDLPGHGASSANLAAASADGLAGSLVELVRALGGTPPPALVGHSYGGYLALAVLREVGDLSGVFLACPVLEPDLGLRVVPPQRFTVIDEQLEFADDEERATFDGEVALRSRAVLDAFRRAVDPAHRVTQRGFLAYVRRRYALSATWSHAVRVFERPLHVVCGQDDYWAGYADALALVRLARRCRMTVLPGCGHLLPIEAGDAMRAELGVWLDQLGG